MTSDEGEAGLVEPAPEGGRHLGGGRPVTSRPEGGLRARQPALTALCRTVLDARAEVRRRRHGTVVPRELADARRALVTALQDYTAALEKQNLPVPPALRSELRMHRELFNW